MKRWLSLILLMGCESPTYHQDIAPLLSQHCGGCHVDGGIAPFALTNIEDVRQWGPAIKASVEAKTMPPWPPGDNSVPMLHERKLSQAEISRIASWVDDDMPLGDASSAAPLLAPELVALQHVDVTVDTGVDYVPDTSLSDDYRCFLVDLGMTDTRIATGISVKPGNGKTVHHVIVTLVAPGDVEKLRAHDAQSERAGWQCFGGPIPSGVNARPSQRLGGWVPGTTAIRYAEGTGVTVASGSFAIVQMHYNLLGGSDPDRTQLQIELAPAGTQLVENITAPLPKLNLTIPVETKNHVEAKVQPVSDWTFGLFFPDGDGFIMGVVGHMHLLGTAISVSVNGKPVLDIPRWDFHWQGQYQLRDPIRIKATDKVELKCTYDNTQARRDSVGFVAPMAEVSWGEGTQDEMCLAYLQVIDNLPTK
jgi:hypothetical protein